MSTSPFKHDVLKGKVTLVSGGGSGINFGIARSLGLHGSKIAIMGRRKEVLDSSVAKLQKEGIDAFGVQGDVRKFADCESVVSGVVAKFGKLDILVNGAAGNFLCAPEDLSANGFKAVMEIDAIGTFHMSKAAFESLKATTGVILNISATLHYTATYYQIHASAAKAAVDSMTRSLAVEWGKYGIRTVGIAPGPIGDTEGMQRLSGGVGLDAIAKSIPLRRVGRIEDIAQAALYLTAAGSYVNGHTIVVDGGSWLQSVPFVSENIYAAVSSQRHLVFLVPIVPCEACHQSLMISHCLCCVRVDSSSLGSTFIVVNNILQSLVKDKTDDLLEFRHYPTKSGHNMFAEVSRPPSLKKGDSYYNRTPVVLIHGMVVASTYLTPLAEQLAPWLQVFAPDLPGYGKSTSKDDSILTFDELVESIVEFLDAVNIERASFLANSFGCQLIAALAQRHPARVDRVVLQGPTMEANQRKSLFGSIAPWLLNGLKEGTPSMGPIMLYDYAHAGFLRFKATVNMCLEDKIEEHLAKIQCPALIISGEKDPVAPFEWCQKLAQITPIAKHIDMKNCSHTQNYSAPKRLARVTRPFLLGPSVFAGNDLRSAAQPTEEEIVEFELPHVADFDSASGMLRATSAVLQGMDFNHLGGNPPALPKILPLFNILPEMIRDSIYARVGAMEAVNPLKLVESHSDETAKQFVRHYPHGVKFPAIAVGSSNGALTHAYAAMGIPWLPQTFLIPVSRPHATGFTNGILDMTKEMEWGREAARQFLDENPDLELHHMADPNQDKLMIEYMAYFRFKFRVLPQAYKEFIKNSLKPGGTILCTDCTLPWKLTKVAERHYFQAGAFGGLTVDEYLYGSERVSERLRQEHGRHKSDENLNWNAPTSDLVNGVEAEWGFITSMQDDLQSFANENGYFIKRLSFESPDHPSPLVAELYRNWYTELGLRADRLLISSFIFMEPFHTLRTGLIPFWTAFSVESCADDVEKYLKEQKQQGTPISQAHSFLFSHGTESIGLATLDRWRSILTSQENVTTPPPVSDDVFVGVDTKCFPKDFASVVNYNPDLKSRFSERFTMPPNMEFEFFENFVSKNCSKYRVTYTEAPSSSKIE